MITREKIIRSLKLQGTNDSSRPGFFLFAAYIIFFVSVVFALRAISSISVGLILLIGLIKNKGFRFDLKGERYLVFFLAGCGLIFFIQCCSLLYTNNVDEGIKLLQRSSGLVFLPLAVFVSRRFFSHENIRTLIFFLAAILSIASLYCLAFALFKYASGSTYKVFFYHDLVKPISQHAIQFSILVFGTLIFLIEDLGERKDFRKSLQRIMIIFLSLFLLLLSSKLIIAFYILYLLAFFFSKKIDARRGKTVAIGLLIFFTAILLIPNPIGNRFRGLFTGNALLFEQKEFNPGIYFNGAQFRLLEWRFTYEILNEQNAWMTGVTPGDAQSLLDKKYKDTKMYTGVPGSKDHGFLGYHTHNQFLQVLLENGWPALVIFLFTCYSLFRMAGNNGKKELRRLASLLIVYCFTDAPLQTQYGLVIFAFLPALFYSVEKYPEKKFSSSADPKISDTNFALHEVIFQRQPN